MAHIACDHARLRSSQERGWPDSGSIYIDVAKLSRLTATCGGGKNCRLHREFFEVSCKARLSHAVFWAASLYLLRW